MNRTEEIAHIAGTDIATADRIRDYIDTWLDLDWSECTTREMITAIKQASKEVR